MRLLLKVPDTWQGQTAIIAGTGLGLTPAVAAAAMASGHRLIAVNDAHRLLPTADILYACDEPWWNEHEGALDFAGERWSSHEECKGSKNDKRVCAERWGLTLVEGRRGKGYSRDRRHINYGQNSGFQAINIAILHGVRRVLLVGFNMQGPHFFGRHPKGLRNSDPRVFLPSFVRASQPEFAPKGVEIVNCTPNSALKCYPFLPLEQALLAP